MNDDNDDNNATSLFVKADYSTILLCLTMGATCYSKSVNKMTTFPGTLKLYIDRNALNEFEEQKLRFNDLLFFRLYE
jgi:hypothetical protein